MDSITPKAHPDAELTEDQTRDLYRQLKTEQKKALQGMESHLRDAIQGDNEPISEEVDLSQRNAEQAFSMQFADKQREKLLNINRALDKLESGEYGLCEGTDEPIGYKRLALQPWTQYSVEYKEQLEFHRRQHRHE